jgi:hypothetical protein
MTPEAELLAAAQAIVRDWNYGLATRPLGDQLLRLTRAVKMVEARDTQSALTAAAKRVT